MTVCCTFDFVSTVGDSPDTVIDSVTAPTSSFALHRGDERGADPDVLVLDRPESLQLELHAIRAGRQPIEAIVAVRVRRLRLDAADQPLAGQRHHHTRQRSRRWHQSRCRQSTPSAPAPRQPRPPITRRPLTSARGGLASCCLLGFRGAAILAYSSAYPRISRRRTRQGRLDCSSCSVISGRALNLTLRK